MRNLTTTLATLAITFAASAASADSWTLNGDMSNVSFGSIKNDYTGESHSFGTVSGAVTDAGAVTLDLALGSVETMIDIRNERMREFVFNNAPSATVSASVDMAAMNALAVGEATTMELDGTLALLGNDVDVYGNLFVMRLAENRVMVTTDGMVMLAMDEAGVDAGIDKLQELAGLDGITRVSPVTLRLVFDQDS